MLFPLMLVSTPDKKPFEYMLHGTISNKETGKPLPDIYLYTVKGEEEAITNKKGEFKFISWQKLPLTLFIHRENNNLRVLISNPSELIRIKL